MAEGAGIGGKGNIFDLLESEAKGQDSGLSGAMLPTGQMPQGDLIDGLLVKDERAQDKAFRVPGSLPFGLKPFEPVSPDELAGNVAQAFKRTSGLAPDQVAEVQTLSKQMGLPEPFVQANLPQVRDLSKYPDPGIEDLIRQHPGTALFLSDPANMALAKDDVSNLRRLEDSLSNLWPEVSAVHAARETSPWGAWDRFWQKNRPVDARTGLAWLLTAPGQAWDASASQDALSNVYAEMLFQGQTPELKAQVERLKSMRVTMPEAKGYGEKILVGGTAQARQFLDLFSPAAIGGMTGYVGGYAGGYAVTRNPAVAQQVAMQGAKLGGAMGAFKAMFNLEGGGALEEYMGFKDENTGKPIDFNLARGAAIVTGLMNAGIEAAELAVLFETMGISKAVSGMTSAMKRQFAKDAVVAGMKLPSTRAMLTQVGARGVGAWLLESGQEGVQELVTAYVGELAKSLHNKGEGQYVAPASPESIGQRVRDTVLDASASFLPIIGGGSAIGAYRSKVALDKARVVEAKLKEFKETLDAQRISQRSPEAIEAAVRQMTGTAQDQAAPPIYISAKAFASYFQQEAPQEMQAALEHLGISEDEFRHAYELNSDIAMPTDKVASGLAQTKHWDALVPDMKVSAFDISAREAMNIDQEEEQVRIADLAKAHDEAQVPKEEIDRLAGELLATGRVNKDQAIATAALFGNMARSLTQGGKETPRAWFERNKVRIQGESLDAFKRRWEGQVGPDAPMLQQDHAALAGADVSNQYQAADAARLWEQLGVESPYFKKWFGGSKVVDEQGKPLVVYHGTRLDFPAFRPDATNSEYGSFFTSNPEHASEYAGDLPQDNGRVLPVYLKIRNPYEVTDQQWLNAEGLSPSEARDAGYDGYVVRGMEGGDTFIVFDPTSIKSVFNRGTFDTADPRLLYQTAEDTGDTPTERLAYFKDSKVRDQGGKLKVMFHGAQRADRIGDRFSKDRATSGPMAFFTDDPEIASGYAKGKQDTSLEIDDLSKFFLVNGLDLRTAWLRTPPLERIRIKEMAHRIGMNEDTGAIEIVLREGENSHGLAGRSTFEYELKQAQGNAYKALFEMWVNSGSIFGEERRFLDVLRVAGVEDAVYNDPYATYPGVFPVYLNIINPLDTSNISKKVIAALKKAAEKNPDPVYPGAVDGWDKRGPHGSGQHWFPYFEQGVKEGHTLAWTVVPDWVTAELKRLGYDGIKDTGGKYSDRAHEVWIPFEENQVKSVFNQNPTADPRLLFQQEGVAPRDRWFSSKLKNALADTKRLQGASARGEPAGSLDVIREDKGRGLTEKVMQALKSMQVPQEEIFWSGLEDYLAHVEATAKEQGHTAKVTRQELLDVVDNFSNSFEDIILLSDEARQIDIERTVLELAQQAYIAKYGAPYDFALASASGELERPESYDTILSEPGIGQRLYDQARAQVDNRSADMSQRVLPDLHDIENNEPGDTASPGDLERMSEYFYDTYLDSARERLTEEVENSGEYLELESSTRSELEGMAADEAQRIRDDFADELEELVNEQEDVSTEQMSQYQKELDAVREVGIYAHSPKDFSLLSELFGKEVMAEVEQRIQDQMESYDFTEKDIDRRVDQVLKDYLNDNISEREVEDYAREEAFSILSDRDPVFFPSLLNGEQERYGVWVLDSEGDGTEYAIGTADGVISDTTFSADEALVILQRRNGEAEDIQTAPRALKSKYDSHKFQGGSNYREHLVRFDLGPDAERHFDNDHFGMIGQDIFGHNRIEDRVDVHGVHGLHAVEMQSDAAQGAEKRGVYSQASLDAVNDELVGLNKWWQEQVAAHPGGPDGFLDDLVKAAQGIGLRNSKVLDVLLSAIHEGLDSPLSGNFGNGGMFADEFARLAAALPAPMGENLMRARWLQNERNALEGSSGPKAVPAMPFLANPENLLTKRLVHYAMAKGYHTLFVSTGAHHTKRWGTPLVSWRTNTEYQAPNDLDHNIELEKQELAAAENNVQTRPEPHPADIALTKGLPIFIAALEKLRTGPDIAAERAQLQALQDKAQGHLEAAAKRIIEIGEKQREIGHTVTNSLVSLVFEVMPPELRNSSSDQAHRASLDIHNHLESYATGTTRLPDYIQERTTPEFMARLDAIREEYLAKRREVEAQDAELYKQRHERDQERNTYGNLVVRLDNWLRMAQVPGLYISGNPQHRGVVFHEGQLRNLEELQQQQAAEMESRYGSKATPWEPFTSRDRLREIVRAAVANQGFTEHRYDQKIEAYTDRVLAQMEKEPSGQFMPRDAGFREAYDRRIKNLLQKIAKSWGGELGMSAITETRERRMAFEPLEPGFEPSLAHAAQFLDALKVEGHLTAEQHDEALHAFSVGDGGHVTAMWRLVDMVVHPLTLKHYAHLLGGRVVDDYAQVPVYKLALDEQGGLTPEQAAKARRLVLEDKLPLYQDKDSVTRGAVSWQHGQTIISLFEKGNVSTVPHELGHIYLTELERAVDAGTATEQQKRDLELIREWVGETGQVIGESGQEQFANGFLTYLREGKAPTSALAEAFASFKRWLLAVYKAARGSGVKINDDIRGVYDRMLASQDELDGITNKYNLDPIFSGDFSLDETVMTSQELKDYESLSSRAELAADIEMQKYKEAERNKFRRHLLEMFNESVKQNMAWRIKSYLLYGADPMGEFASDKRVNKKAKNYSGSTLGLNLEDAIYHWGKEGIEGIQLGLLKKDGRRLDDFMMEWGIESETTVYDALHFSLKKTRDTFLESNLAQFDAEWRATATPWANELQEKRMDAEARIFKRLASQFVPATLEGIRRLVSRKVENMTIEQLQASFDNLKAVVAKASQMMKAENFMLRAAMKHEQDKALAEQRQVSAERIKELRQGWAERVAEANERRRIALAEVRERVRARDELGKMKRLASSIFKSGSIDWDYREQAMAIVQRFGLGTERMTPALPEQMPLLMQFVQEKGIEADALAEIPAWLFAEPRGGKRSVMAMTVGQMRELRNALQFLKHRGITEKKMLGLAEDVSVATVAEKSVETGSKLEKGPKMLSARERDRQSWRMRFRGLAAELMNMRYLADAFDGFTNHGPDSVAGNTTKYLVYPFDRAESGKQEMLRKFGDKFDKIFEPYRAQDLTSTFKIEGVPLSAALDLEWGGMWDRQKVLMVALNMGNEGNLRALMQGYGWDERHLATITSRLTPEEWRMVQKIWDTIDELYPEIDKVHRIINGTPLSKVEAKPLNTPGGHLRGGYFPLIFDHRLSDKAAFMGGMDKLMNEVEAGAYADEIQHQAAVFRKSNPMAGFTKGRVGTSLPPLLSLGVLSHHLNASLHYVNYAVAVRNGYKLVTVPEFRSAWVKAFGEDAYLELGGWLRRQARPGLVMSGHFDKMFEKMRMLGGIQALGLSLQTTLTQLSSIPQSWQEIGFKAFVKGAGIMAEHGVNAWQAASELSAYMADRRHNLDSTMRDLVDKLELDKHQITALAKLGLNVTVKDYQEFLFSWIQTADAMVAYPTWYGAYDQAINKLGMAQADAVLYADEKVKRAQASGGLVDSPSFLRTAGIRRLFSMFMSFSVNLLNNQAYFVRGLREGFISKGDFTRHVMLSWVLPPVLSSCIVAWCRGEPWPDARDLFFDIFGYLISGLPIVREMARSIEFGGRSGGAAALKPIEDIGKLAMRSVNLLDDKDRDGEFLLAAQSLVDLIGFSLGIPTRPIWRAAQGVHDMSEGKTVNPLRLFFKAPKEEK